MHSFCAERELAGRGSGLPPDRDRLFRGENGIKFGDADPQIPVVDAGIRFVEESHAQQARAPENDCRAWDEIPTHQLPEEISMGTPIRIGASLRETLLVPVEHSAVNHPGVGTRLERFDLRIQRVGKSHIVVVQKAQILGRAGHDSDVSRPADAESPPGANITNATNVSPTFADLLRLIFRSIVNDDDLHVASCKARAFYGSRNKRAAVACGNNNADARHYGDPRFG